MARASLSATAFEYFAMANIMAIAIAINRAKTSAISTEPSRKSVNMPFLNEDAHSLVWKYSHKYGSGDGAVYGTDDGSGFGDGVGYIYGDGSVYDYGSGYGNGNGSGDFYGYIYGYGEGW